MTTMLLRCEGLEGFTVSIGILEWDRSKFKFALMQLDRPKRLARDSSPKVAHNTSSQQVETLY